MDLLSRRLLLPLLTALIGIGTPYLIEGLQWDHPDPRSKVRKFEKALQERVDKLERELEGMVEKGKRIEAPRKLPFPKAEEGFLYTILKGDSLLRWSSNELKDPEALKAAIDEDPLIKRENGWFFGKEVREGERTYIGSALIKKDHRYENRYLKDHFFQGSGLPADAKILRDTAGKGERVRPVSVEGRDPLFWVAYPDEKKTSEKAFWLAMILNTIGFLALLLFLFRLESRLSAKYSPAWVLPFFALLLFLVRQFTLMNQFPGIWHRSELFSPTLYAASDRFPTLGDLAINSVLLLFLAFLFHHRLKGLSFPRSRWRSFLYAAPPTLLVVAFGLWGVELIRGAVENSNIFLDLNQPFRLSAYSLIGLFAVGVLLFAFYLLADLLIAWTDGRKRELSYVLGTSLIGLAVFAYGIGIERVRALLPVTVLFSLAWVYYRRGGRYAFPQAVFILAVFAFFTASLFSFYSSLKERQNRAVLAEKLADDEDPVTDLRFDELEDRLARDSTLIKSLQGTVSGKKVRKKLKREYFRGYWNEYRVNAYLFDKKGSFVFRMNDHSSRSRRELERLMTDRGSHTDLSEHLHYVHRSPDLVNYVARLPVGGGKLYVELMSRQVPRELGFPALLLRGRSDMMRELRNYSYARFLEGRLVDRAGTYSYRRELSAYKGLEGEQTWMEKGGYKHFFYRTGKGNAIVLSRPIEGNLAKATTFSYLFIFFSILLLLFVGIKDLSSGLGEWQLSLKGKVRLLMVGITLASVLIFAGVTRSYVRDQYRSKNERQILEKTRSVLLKLDDKIGRDPQLSPTIKGYTEHTLSELSNVFFTDINLYGPQGRLFATSREQVFKEGLIGRYIHPSAYKTLKRKKKSEFVQKERIGKMDYLSAYMPLSNDKGELLGYLNLPYFAKQNELEQELSAFFVAILNIFVLLFALSLIAALFISSWVTRPLRRLQESLSRVELGASNDPLEYHGKDEIGELVEEYNRKVAELEEKADALARSERESAWREMAKQVAHEIKNPLTPMRLQLQQLKRSGQGMDPEGLAKTADRLIERIDALSRIASEFSHFAEMPRAEEEQVELDASVRNTIALYEENPRLSIELSKDFEGPAYVLADPDQLGRVFSNLLSNAIEAIPEERIGKVELDLEDGDDFWIAGVRDNGTGIPEEFRERVFEPNFTTRGRGSGLGLAIAKNIVEASGGSIEILSSSEEGTFIRMKFPKAGE